METAEREVKECSCNPEYIHTSTASCCASSAAAKKARLGLREWPANFCERCRGGPPRPRRLPLHCLSANHEKIHESFSQPGRARARRGRKKPFRPTLKKAPSPSGREKGGRPGVGVPSSVLPSLPPSLPPSFMSHSSVTVPSIAPPPHPPPHPPPRGAVPHLSIYLSFLPLLVLNAIGPLPDPPRALTHSHSLTVPPAPARARPRSPPPSHSFLYYLYPRLTGPVAAAAAHSFHGAHLFVPLYFAPSFYVHINGDYIFLNGCTACIHIRVYCIYKSDCTCIFEYYMRGVAFCIVRTPLKSHSNLATE